MSKVREGRVPHQQREVELWLWKISFGMEYLNFEPEMKKWRSHGQWREREREIYENENETARVKTLNFLRYLSVTI